LKVAFYWKGGITVNKKDYSQNCDFDDDSGKNDCWHCIHFLFPIGCMYGEDEDIKMPHNRRNKPLYSMKEICEMNGVRYEDGDINEA
jgi:hypothetical protein